MTRPAPGTIIRTGRRVSVSVPMNQALLNLRKRVQFEADEPGVLLVLLILAVFLLFSPGGACNYDAAAGATPVATQHADDGASH